MPKFVILGSTRHQPYTIMAVPNKLDNYVNDERSYQEAFRWFKPAIELCDIVIVYAVDGIGEHTRRDMEYAKSQDKRVILIVKDGVMEV